MYSKMLAGYDLLQRHALQELMHDPIEKSECSISSTALQVMFSQLRVKYPTPPRQASSGDLRVVLHTCVPMHTSLVRLESRSGTI